MGHCEKVATVFFISTNKAISQQAKKDEIVSLTALTRKDCLITPNSH